jgi:hypothetical protein
MGSGHDEDSTELPDEHDRAAALDEAARLEASAPMHDESPAAVASDSSEAHSSSLSTGDSTSGSDSDSVPTESDSPEPSDDDQEQRASASAVEGHLHEPLFDGDTCTASLFDAIELLLGLQREYNISKEAMRAVFDTMRVLLPPTHRLCGYDQAVRAIQKYGIQEIQVVDSCVNDCVLFENAPVQRDVNLERQLADYQHCPICAEARFDAAGKPRKVGCVVRHIQGLIVRI